MTFLLRLSLASDDGGDAEMRVNAGSHVTRILAHDLLEMAATSFCFALTTWTWLLLVLLLGFDVEVICECRCKHLTDDAMAVTITDWTQHFKAPFNTNHIPIHFGRSNYHNAHASYHFLSLFFLTDFDQLPFPISRVGNLGL